MSTEVELLRRAAALMRERARKATPGPWRVEREDLWIRIQSESVAGWQGEVADVHTPDETWPDYEHIASWHPAAALAVADWLDTCAGIWAGNADWVMKVATTHGALEVARAYLGEVRDA